ncbi:pantoate--beta-alanine ligase [Candidatus Pelagibacter sp. HIMB1623]|uniref:pantoate--beta-alanine ligase n=1 Tax=Candidatus Pelagibacter sp. HIMB1623 TaxID=3413358 RepID=UPI003F850492
MFYLSRFLIQMKIILNNNSLFKALRPFNDIGFVPTMGSIHEGHLSLIERSNQTCKKTIVSIFVNPKQFNNKKDFKNYPTNIKEDIKILKKTKKVDFLYIPKFKDVYNNNKKSNIKITKKDKILCAKFRKGHFEGVLDVMGRLTNLVNPKKIFMGKKDYQQYFLIKNYLKNKYKASIVPCKTIRNKNKIALSSRNNHLDLNGIKKASVLSKSLIKLKKNLENSKKIKQNLKIQMKYFEKFLKINIEYLELRSIKNLKISNTVKGSRLFVAYYIDNVRLIDNF